MMAISCDRCVSLLLAQSGRYLSAEVYDNGRLLRRRYVTYERDKEPINSTGMFDTNRRLLKQRIIYDDDSARYADRDHSSFDGLGHYRQTTLGGTFDALGVDIAFTKVAVVLAETQQLTTTESPATAASTAS